GASDEGPNLGRTVGNKMTINYAAIDRTKNDFGLKISESLALDAGGVGHEGAHVGAGGFLTEFFTMHGEHTAYYSESLTYQGLHNTDRPTGLWNESWVLVDHRPPRKKSADLGSSRCEVDIKRVYDAVIRPGNLSNAGLILPTCRLFRLSLLGHHVCFCFSHPHARPRTKVGSWT